VKPVIMVFAKAPRPGRVKTRLHGVLGPSDAASLHRALVADLLETLATLAGEADCELHTDVPTDAWADYPVARKLQIEGGLGERMLGAIGQALAEGRPRALIAGADAPGLPAGHLRSLLAAEADVALGPAEDGGYWGIACRRCSPGMFDGVPWSTPQALEATMQAAARCGLTTWTGPSWRDLDEPADLAWLRLERSLSRHTAAWLERWAGGQANPPRQPETGRPDRALQTLE
jgi:uncharacterized protein